MNDAGAGAAPSRNDLAEDRTILASERTYAGWLRTSLGCFAIAIALHALFGTGWVPRAIATRFLGLAVLIAWLAARRATAVVQRLNTHVVVTAKPINLALITVAISLGAAALAAAIWLFPATA